jgi:FtsP/CotA-like multicopper oxidase with cupredoxin domain
MQTNNWKAILKAALRVVCILPFAAVVAFGQQQVNLTAGPATATLPDGSAVPMWGYSCGTAATGSTATCAALNPLVTAGGWSPVVITVPTGQGLTINLTNNLSFAGGTVPTSLVIVGQLGGGLGTVTASCNGTATSGATCTPSPDHSNAQSVTWPIADPLTKGAPPAQGPRVQSFSTEVAAGGTTPLTWTALRPGTYLIESGTHPSIQGPMGLYGILVVTTAPVGATPGTAYPAVGTVPAVTYGAEVPLLLSEIDPVQNNAVAKAVTLPGFSETTVWSGQPGGCGNPATANSGNCYPPAVNYTPLYYLFNGVAFNKTNASASLFPATAGTTTNSAGIIVPVTIGITGNVLVRLVNAGLRMHVPSIVGSQTGVAVAPATTPPFGFSLIAEDGNVLPGIPRVQNEVFMAPGKTYDVVVNLPAATATALPIYDRELSLSGNATARDAGMLAYIGVNGSALPSSPALGVAIARADAYNSVIVGQTLTVSDPSKGLIANDTNVYGVQLVGTVPGLTLNANGTFTYLGSPTSFTYCANGAVTGTTCSSGITASVALNAAQLEAASGIVMNPITYTSNVATSLSIKSPGILSVDKDNAGYPLTVAASSVAPSGSGWTVSVDKNGGFNASVPAAGTYTFSYKAQNSQGTVSSSRDGCRRRNKSPDHPC